MSNVSDDLKKVLLAGVGAVATGAEKTVELAKELAKRSEVTLDSSKGIVNDLVKKGELTMEQGKVIMEELAKKGEKTLAQGKVLNSELKHNIKEKFKDLTDAACKKDAPLTAQAVVDNIDKMSKEDLDAIKAKIAEMESAGTDEPHVE